MIFSMRHLDIAERQRPNDKESRPTSRSALPIIDLLKAPTVQEERLRPHAPRHCRSDKNRKRRCYD